MASNPAIQRGLANLAQMFKPPDAGELVAYGRLGEMNRQRQAMDAYAATLPSGRREQFLAVGPENFLRYGPQREIYDDTVNRGLSAEEIGRRRLALGTSYGDTAMGVRENITGQNQRNTQDNARQIVQTIMTPTPAGAVRDVPQGVAAAVSRQFGINLEPGRSYGVINAGPNTVSVDPNTNTELARGPRQASSPDQLAAFILSDRLQSGQATQDEILDATLAPRTELVQGPNGTAVRVPARQAVGQPAAAAPVAQQPTELSRLQAERAGLPAGDPRAAEYDRRIRALGQTPGVESAVDKGIGELIVNETKGALEGVRNAASAQSTAQAIRQLAQNPNTIQGAGASARLFVQRIGALVGLDPTRVQLTEVLDTLTNEAVLARSGGSLGAQISNSDRDFLRSAGPNIERDARTNMVLADILSAAADRQAARAQFGMQLLEQNGGNPPRDMPQRMAQWDAANPPRNVVTQMLSQQPDAPAAAPQAPIAPAAPDAQGAAEAAATGGAPAQPSLPVVRTPQEAAALPPGTPFMTPDGQQRVRR